VLDERISFRNGIKNTLWYYVALSKPEIIFPDASVSVNSKEPGTGILFLLQKQPGVTDRLPAIHG